jgi:hypothetical protein
MSILISDWLHTSNDVLRCLMSKHGVPALEALVAAPSAEAVQDSAQPRVIEPDLACKRQFFLETFTIRFAQR